MEKNLPKAHKLYFEKFSSLVTKFTGSWLAFTLAFSMVTIWLVLGKIIGFSGFWEDIFDTSVTVITFLMVFIIQNSQNKDGLVIQLKLNEIVAALEGASNRLVDVEDMTEDDLKVLQKYYKKLNKSSQKEENLGKSHSVEEAEHNEKNKLDK